MQLKREDDRQVQGASQQSHAFETTCWADDLQSVAEVLLKYPGYEAASKTFNKLAQQSQGTLEDKISWLKEKKV
jgi:hypothetical protein